MVMKRAYYALFPAGLHYPRVRLPEYGYDVMQLASASGAVCNASGVRGEADRRRRRRIAW